MIIEFPFEFGEHVYYAPLNGLAKSYFVEEGTVFGFSVYRRKGEVDIKINFKQDSVPVSLVSKNRQEIEEKVIQLNAGLKSV